MSFGFFFRLLVLFSVSALLQIRCYAMFSKPVAEDSDSEDESTVSDLSAYRRRVLDFIEKRRGDSSALEKLLVRRAKSARAVRVKRRTSLSKARGRLDPLKKELEKYALFRRIASAVFKRRPEHQEAVDDAHEDYLASLFRGFSRLQMSLLFGFQDSTSIAQLKFLIEEFVEIYDELAAIKGLASPEREFSDARKFLLETLLRANGPVISACRDVIDELKQAEGAEQANDLMERDARILEAAAAIRYAHQKYPVLQPLFSPIGDIVDSLISRIKKSWNDVAHGTDVVSSVDTVEQISELVIRESVSRYAEAYALIEACNPKFTDDQKNSMARTQQELFLLKECENGLVFSKDCFGGHRVATPYISSVLWRALDVVCREARVTSPDDFSINVIRCDDVYNAWTVRDDFFGPAIMLEMGFVELFVLDPDLHTNTIAHELGHHLSSYRGIAPMGEEVQVDLFAARFAPLGRGRGAIDTFALDMAANLLRLCRRDFTWQEWQLRLLVSVLTHDCISGLSPESPILLCDDLAWRLRDLIEPVFASVPVDWKSGDCTPQAFWQVFECFSSRIKPLLSADVPERRRVCLGQNFKASHPLLARRHQILLDSLAGPAQVGEVGASSESPLQILLAELRCSTLSIEPFIDCYAPLVKN